MSKDVDKAKPNLVLESCDTVAHKPDFSHRFQRRQNHSILHQC